jgi:putative transposase
MATDNPSWGYCRIQGALKHLGHRVARSTIAKTLKEHGIKPSPDRLTSWRTFLKTHADVIAAADFVTTEVWTARGLVTHYVWFAIDISTRAVEILGVTTNPDGAFMAQIARTSFQAPNMDFFAERFVLSVKSECIDQMILFGVASLRRAWREFCAHDHTERPHQGLRNALITPDPRACPPSSGSIVAPERLGGLLRYYHRLVA